MKDFNLLIKQCYFIVLSVENKQIVKNPKVSNTKKGKLMNLSKFAAGDTSKSRFIENWKASGILSSLGLKTHLHRIPVFDSI